MNQHKIGAALAAMVLALAVYQVSAQTSPMQWVTSPTDPRIPVPAEAVSIGQVAAGDGYVDSSISPEDLAHLYVAELPAHGWIFDSSTSHLNGTEPGLGGTFVVSVCMGNSWSAVDIGAPTDGTSGSELILLVDYDTGPCP